MWQIYAEKIGVDPEPIVAARARRNWMRRKRKRWNSRRIPPMRQLPRYWDAFRGGRYDASLEVDTGVAAAEADGDRRSAVTLSRADFTFIRR